MNQLIQGGMACTDCHTGAQAQQRATLPGVAVCLVCHESAVTQSTEEAKIRAVAAAQKELVWRQVTHVPAHVYFSHRRHVQVARLECNLCHGRWKKQPRRRADPIGRSPWTLASNEITDVMEFLGEEQARKEPVWRPALQKAQATGKP